MSRPTLPAWFRAAVEESRLIASRHDGEHMLHSDAVAVEFMGAVFRNGDVVDPVEVERVLMRMRRYEITGQYDRQWS